MLEYQQISLGHLAALDSKATRRLGAAKKKLKLRSEDNIVRYGRCYQAACGIYFLIKENHVIYVGQAINVMSRIIEHARCGRDFDTYNFIRCHRSQLDEWERAYINALMPPLNRDAITKRRRAESFLCQKDEETT